MNNSFSDITSGIIWRFRSFPHLRSHVSHNTGFRNMSNTNLNKLRERLRSINWSVVYNQREVHSSFENFLYLLTSSYNSTIPLPGRKFQNNLGSLNLSLGLLIEKIDFFINTRKLQIFKIKLDMSVIAMFLHLLYV